MKHRLKRLEKYLTTQQDEICSYASEIILLLSVLCYIINKDE
uniref:Uncharacterized protein n=1 Tax=Anguilla anguilla TaxID=7936 RepID=A0A0E9TR31_ANGAN